MRFLLLIFFNPFISISAYAASEIPSAEKFSSVAATPNERNKIFATYELEELNLQAAVVWALLLECNNSQDRLKAEYYSGRFCSDPTVSPSAKEKAIEALRALKGNTISFLLSSHNPYVGMGIAVPIIDTHPLLAQILIEIIIAIRWQTELAISTQFGSRYDRGTIKVDTYLLQCSLESNISQFCHNFGKYLPANRAKYALEIARTILRSTSNKCTQMGFSPNQALLTFLETNNLFGTHISFHSPLQKEDLASLDCINDEYKKTVLSPKILDIKRQTELKSSYADMLKPNTGQ